MDANTCFTMPQQMANKIIFMFALSEKCATKPNNAGGNMSLFDYRGSVSDIQLYREEPSLWILKHHPDYKYRTKSGAAAQRGLSVEHALAMSWRFNLTLEQATLIACRSFIRARGEPMFPDDLKEYNDIPSYVSTCFDIKKELGESKYTAFQKEVVGEIEGVPFLGFIDFQFEGYDIDLKTTGRCPSSMKEPHIEQMSFYQYVTGKPIMCVYSTPKKFDMFTLTEDQYTTGMNRLKSTVRSIKTALGYDWETLFELFTPRDINGFRWDEKSRFIASNIWSI